MHYPKAEMKSQNSDPALRQGIKEGLPSFLSSPTPLGPASSTRDMAGSWSEVTHHEEQAWKGLEWVSQDTSLGDNTDSLSAALSSLKFPTRFCVSVTENSEPDMMFLSYTPPHPIGVFLYLN